MGCGKARAWICIAEQGMTMSLQLCQPWRAWALPYGISGLSYSGVRHHQQHLWERPSLRNNGALLLCVLIGHSCVNLIMWIHPYASCRIIGDLTNAATAVTLVHCYCWCWCPIRCPARAQANATIFCPANAAVSCSTFIVIRLYLFERQLLLLLNVTVNYLRIWNGTLFGCVLWVNCWRSPIKIMGNVDATGVR